MDQSKRNFEQVIVLTLGKVISIVLSFMIPFFLGRFLTVEAYGTYKQLMIIFMLAMILLNMGMDNTLYYFMKKYPLQWPVISLNIITFNVGISMLLWGAAFLFRDSIALALKNPELADYFPLFFSILILSVPTVHFSEIFLAFGKIKWKIYLDLLAELGKTISILGGHYFFQSLHMVLWGFFFTYLFYFMGMLIYYNRQLRKSSLSYSFYNELFSKQIKYAWPLGLSNILSLIMDFEKFLVSAWFGLQRFTMYVVGCFDIPLLPAIRQNMNLLMRIEMADADEKGDMRRIQDSWISTQRKFFLIQIPLLVFMIIFANEVITFIFSDKYRESAIFFQVFNGILFVNALSPDPVFMVFAKTNLMLRLQMMILPMRLVLLITCAYFFGPLGALTGKLLGNGLLVFMGLHQARVILQLSWNRLFIWDQMIKVSLLALTVGYGIKHLLTSFSLSPFILLSGGFCLYTLFIFLLALFYDVIKEDERLYLKGMMAKGLRTIKP